ncbi:MAG: nitroreductase family protein [Desulfovibrionaceae bacterium]|nr:nitroreductase family protein [Desulfovibrionaceae bacterium]
MQRSITVDVNTCCHCGLCVKDCVVNALQMNEGEVPRYAPGKEEHCVGCQHCFAICPTGALSFGNKQAKDSQKVGFGNSDELIRLIQSRRSIRFYKKEDVGQEILNKLVAMLPYAPTGGNADNLHFSIISTREKMDEIRNIAYTKIGESRGVSSSFLQAKKAFDSGNDIIFRDAPAMVGVALDLGKTIPGCEIADPIIALSYFELYAQSLGLGTLWCDYALMVAKEFPDVYAKLNIPENYALQYIMLFGLPAVGYNRTIQPEMFSIKVIK